MKRKHMARLLALCLLAGHPISIAEEESPMIASIYTDRSAYTPGETVHGTAILANPDAAAQLVISASHLGVQVGNPIIVPVAENASSISFLWTPPSEDFRGYVLTLALERMDGQTLDTAYIGVDVSSSWTKFPRYGYVWNYTQDAEPEAIIESLSRYHINGIQYYDWMYRHHIPSNGEARWQDWSGRWIEGDVIRRYIAAAREKGIASMAYNMIYAANQTYLRDGSGVNPAWRLVKQNGDDFTISMSATRGSIGILQYFNILNPDWQRYITDRMIEAMDALGFDGWHGDTIGEHGHMTTPEGKPLGYDADGNPIHLAKDGYTAFLNTAKAALDGRYLAFNPVGAQGIEQVNISDVDVLYTEFWPWDPDRNGIRYTTYRSLRDEIERAAVESGGKSLIVAGYINYRGPNEYFNDPAVRLMDSVVFAAGGARIELGNGEHMLSDEYFPSDGNMAMSDGLKAEMRVFYDFIVAYQNLLRDGQVSVDRRIAVDGYPSGASGKGNAIWAFVKADDRHEVLHLINLLGTDNGWRDETQTKRMPTQANDIPVKIYTDRPITEVFALTPDGGALAPVPLFFEGGEDRHGSYVACTVPSLVYWTMVVMR